MRTIPFALSLLLTLLISLPAFAQTSRVATDFDGDGLSDFVLIEDSPTGLQWNALESSGAALRALGGLGYLGNHLALAKWLDTAGPHLAVVAGNAATRQIDWTLADGSPAGILRSFGEMGQTAIAGADFNGDGKADPAVVFKRRNRLIWRISPDLFSTNSLPVQELTWGGNSEQPFFISPDGLQDWVATIRRTGIRAYLLRMKHLQSGELRRLRGTGSFGSVRPVQRPVPVALASGADSLMVSRRGSTSTTLTFLDIVTGAQTEKELPGVGDVVVGNFTAEEGEEVAVQGTDSFSVYNQTTGLTTVVAAPAGIATDEININPVTAASQGDGDSPAPAPDPGPVAPGLEGVCAVRSAISMGQMLIKSEISSHIHGKDPRATGYTLVCASQCPKTLHKSDFFYADGSYAGSVGYYGRFHGNGKPRLYGAAGGAPQHFARDIAARARTIGNGKLYMQISTAKSGAGTECKEFNPSGRNGGL